VPGLLQTAAYAEVRILSSLALRQVEATEPAPATETEVAARVARQVILTRSTDPTRYEAVIEEGALAGRGGPPEVMRDQLRHLHQLASLPNVTLRVLPSNATIGDRYLPHTPFSIYRFADPADPETVAVEAVGSDLVSSETPSVRRYSMVFSWLREAALSAEESLAWLATRAIGQDEIAD